MRVILMNDRRGQEALHMSKRLFEPFDRCLVADVDWQYLLGVEILKVSSLAWVSTASDHKIAPI